MQVFGFRKMSRATGEVVDVTELEMPAVQYTSRATWTAVTDGILNTLQANNPSEFCHRNSSSSPWAPELC